MNLLDDPRMTPLQREDRLFVGGVLAVLAIMLMGTVVWHDWQSRPLTQLTRDPGMLPSIQIDINRAEWAELALLPGVGEVLARRIVDFRADIGAFSSVDQLDDVKGIGPKLLVGIRPLVRPVSVPHGTRGGA